MTVEKLLQPRIKVVAPYPGMSYEVGQIIELNNDDAVIYDYRKYHHLFKELSWYEEREEKDMPEYVWTISNRIAHVKKWVKEPLFIADLGTHAIKVELLQPATKEEYENQKQ